MAGSTRSLGSAIMGSGPFTMRTTDGSPNLDAIRSFTVGNNTDSTTVNVYLGAIAAGDPYWQVQPLSNITLPIQAQTALTFTFSDSLNEFNGTTYLHIDSEALTASGFQTPSQLPSPVLAPQGYIFLLGGALLQWGSTLVAADASAPANIVFPRSFGTQIFQFTHAIDTGSSDDGLQLAARFYSAGLSGMTAVVSGGPPASTCTLRYMVIGA